MHELLNIRTKQTISFAEDIDELTPEQYLFYLDLLLQHNVGQITDPFEIKRKLFVKLTDLKISRKLIFYKADVEEEIWAALTEKINLLDSFFDIETVGEKKKYSMHLKCGTNLLPTWANRKGPEDMLNNITWGEFISCLNALKLISKAEETKDIAEIQSNTIDIFNTLYKKTSRKEPKHIPDMVYFHAVTYFSYIYELITTVPIPINGEEIDFSIIWKSDDDDENTIKEDKSGWSGILFSIAEAGVFGKAADVNNANLYDVLIYLYRQKLQERHDKKQLKKQENG